MSTGFDEWCWGQNIFYAGFGFTNWPNDVCNDLVLQKDGFESHPLRHFVITNEYIESL